MLLKPNLKQQDTGLDGRDASRAGSHLYVPKAESAGGRVAPAPAEQGKIWERGVTQRDGISSPPIDPPTLICIIIRAPS